MEVKLSRKKSFNFPENKTQEGELILEHSKLTPIHGKAILFLIENQNKNFEEDSLDKSTDSKSVEGSYEYISDLENSFENLKTLTFKIFYSVQEVIKQIEVIICDDQTIKDLIIFSIKLINEELKSEKNNFSFDLNNLNKYSIKILKANGEHNIIDNGESLANLNLDNKFYLIENGQNYE